MLSGLSSWQRLRSMLANGSIMKDEQLTEAIGECFYRLSSGITSLNFQPIPAISLPDSYMISPLVVEVQLFRNKERKPTRPDEIPSCILKSCAGTLSIAICSIFNASVKNGNCTNSDRLFLCAWESKVVQGWSSLISKIWRIIRSRKY